MTSFDFGDVVRVPFPHVERNVSRYRPALVVTQGALGPNGLLIWVAMITSAERAVWPGDVSIANFRTAGLPIASVVRTAKVATLETKSAQLLGRLAPALIAQVQEQLRRHLGLA